MNAEGTEAAGRRGAPRGSLALGVPSALEPNHVRAVCWRHRRIVRLLSARERLSPPSTSAFIIHHSALAEKLRRNLFIALSESSDHPISLRHKTTLRRYQDVTS